MCPYPLFSCSSSYSTPFMSCISALRFAILAVWDRYDATGLGLEALTSLQVRGSVTMLKIDVSFHKMVEDPRGRRRIPQAVTLVFTRSLHQHPSDLVVNTSTSTMTRIYVFFWRCNNGEKWLAQNVDRGVVSLLNPMVFLREPQAQNISITWSFDALYSVPVTRTLALSSSLPISLQT